MCFASISRAWAVKLFPIGSIFTNSSSSLTLFSTISIAMLCGFKVKPSLLLVIIRMFEQAKPILEKGLAYNLRQSAVAYRHFRLAVPCALKYAHAFADVSGLSVASIGFNLRRCR
jgi:hypothetical protein